MAKTNLVIVESPSKAKTIGKYLGPDYEVVASMGHVRDLPKSTLGVDIKAGFVPDYQPIKGKEDAVKALKKAAKASEKVYLATDPDREGEAISWHLKELLDIPDSKALRVTFNEITQRVVTESIAAPRAIDADLVDAQQARRILDRIVGYQLSPLLWKKVRRGLSAGRVQSVATRLVVEREEEIDAFQPKEYWSVEASLRRMPPNVGALTAQYYGKGGKKQELISQAQAEAVTAAVEGKSFTVSGVKRQEKTRQPAPPFTTSTLQQEASRKLNMSPARTMSVAQQLYEGIDITGQGTVGLITYMRTDSLRLSDDALAQAKDFIKARYGAAYYPAQTRRFKAKSNAQDAHEAIRPSDVTLVPEDIKKDLTGEQYRLYKLIWSRFLACQMANAVYDSVSMEMECAGYDFHASHSSVKFSGFTAVYEEGKDEEDEVFQSALPDMKQGEQLSLEKLEKAQHFTQPPARYTEATLIRALEEKGIGRPSTYAPTIATILNRVYVIKEGKSLRPTPVGKAVTRWMQRNFQNIMDYEFTAWMENKLDGVEKGETGWKQLMADFYRDFEPLVGLAEEGPREPIEPWESTETCPVCGKTLVYKIGQFGMFLACPGWREDPPCNFTMPVVVEMPGKCHLCGGRLVKRTGISKTSGKQYTYYCCVNHNSKDERISCSFSTFDVPVKDLCPQCGRTMFKLSGRGAKKPFCINEECSAFLPEDKRGGWRKAAEETKKGEKKTTAKKTAVKKATAKKTAAKKTTAKKTAKKEAK